MTKAVIFDMYETLITHYDSPLYFGAQMAEDAGIPEENFQAIWRPTEYERTIGKLSFEAVVENILRVNHCYTDQLLRKIVRKRMEAKEECFHKMHSEIIPLLSALKNNRIQVGLISNCFSEEVIAIRNSILFPHFDGVYLSYEQGLQKPEEEIFYRCLRGFMLKPEDCVYVGDGGSEELETARKIGMEAVQAAWYLKEGTTQPVGRKLGFPQMERPMEVLEIVRR